jgi:hypothetical protein
MRKTPSELIWSASSFKNTLRVFLGARAVTRPPWTGGPDIQKSAAGGCGVALKPAAVVRNPTAASNASKA